MRKFLWVAVIALASLVSRGQSVVYTTGFEASEGYDIRFTLAGQRNWLIDGTGGNGLMLEAFAGYGQQAYLGFHAPTDTNTTTIWTPVNYAPLPDGASIVKFSVLMQIYQSSTGGDDEFRWSVYNKKAERLFSIDFFTKYRRIYYELDDRQLYDTGWEFAFAQEDPDGVYELVIWMDLGRNSWTALLNDQLIVNAEPITLGDLELTLGDVDAVWAPDAPLTPGDNALVFDDYTVTAEPFDTIPIPPILEAIKVDENSDFQFVVYGQLGATYSVEVKSDFRDEWTPLLEFQNDQGTFTFLDDTAHEYPYGFYRVVEVEP